LDFFQALKIQNYQQETIDLHRGIASAMAELGYRIDHLQEVSLVEGLRLFPEERGSEGYLGDTSLLGKAFAKKKWCRRENQFFETLLKREKTTIVLGKMP
jgi:hypothetical protein